jgi:hypothetical protein
MTPPPPNQTKAAVEVLPVTGDPQELILLLSVELDNEQRDSVFGQRLPCLGVGSKYYSRQ